MNIPAPANVLTLTLILSFGLTACKRSDPGTASQPPAFTPLDDTQIAEVTALGKTLEEKLASGQPEVFLKVYDIEEVARRALGDEKLPKAFWRGLSNNLKESQSAILDRVAQGDMTFIEYREGTNRKPILLFRNEIDGGFDYVEYTLRPSPDHEYGWVFYDAYTYSLGTSVSEIMRSSLLPFLKTLDDNAFQKLMRNRKDAAAIQSVPEVVAAMRLAQSPEPASADEARRVFYAIPEAGRASRFARMVEVLIAGRFLNLENIDDNDEYLQVLERFEADYPNDPSLAMLSIDQGILTKDFERAHKALDQLQSSIDDDYLELHHGWIYFNEKKYEKADDIAKAYIENHPDRYSGYELRLETSFETRDFEVLADIVTMLEADFGLDFSSAIVSEDWKAFIGSKPGKAWVKNR